MRKERLTLVYANKKVLLEFLCPQTHALEPSFFPILKRSKAVGMAENTPCVFLFSDFFLFIKEK